MDQILLVDTYGRKEQIPRKWEKGWSNKPNPSYFISYKIAIYKKAPGPGSYRSPPEFGQYDVKKDLRASTSNMNERIKNKSSNTDRTKMSSNMNMSQEAWYFTFNTNFWL